MRFFLAFMKLFFLPFRNAKKYERKDTAEPDVAPGKTPGSKDGKSKRKKDGDEADPDAKKPKKAKKDKKAKK